MQVTLTPEILIAALVLFDNRATEWFKRLLIDNTKWSDSIQGAAVMGISFGVAIIGVLLLPGVNQFTSVAASPLASVIIEGVAIAGLANGLDFISGKVSDGLDKVTQPSTDLDPDGQSHA